MSTVVLDEQNAKYPVKLLDDSNYFNWSFRMETIFQHKELWRIVSDVKPEPTPPDWEKKNQHALTLIRLSIDDAQIKHIRGINSAKGAWDALKQMHERDTPGNKIRLLRQIMQQHANESDDIQQHVNSLTELFQKFLALGDGKLESEFFMCATLLSSLPSSYDSVILAMEARREEEINANLVRNTIIEEYRRRKARDNSSVDDVALKVVADGRKPSSSTPSSKPTCHFCKKPGHIKKQCRKFMQWKNNNEGKNSGHEGANVVKNSLSKSEILFLAGIIDGWILDSGATCHIARDQKLFLEIDKSHKETITIANGDEVKACGKGKVRVCFINGAGESTQVLIENVLYVPSIGTNLISVKRLTEKGFKVNFSGTTCEIRTHDNRRQISIGDITGNLYKMRTGAQRINAAIAGQQLCVHEWHRILGHRGLGTVKKIPSKQIVDGMKIGACKPNCVQDCSACIEGKMARMPFPKESKTTTAAVLDLIHSDICGPMQAATPQGKRYILTFIDDHSRYATIYLLREKSEALAKFKEFHQLVWNKFGTKIKAFRSDGGGEYVGKKFVEFLNLEGIMVQRSAPYSPQQNGVAERKNRTLIEMARCMLSDAKLEKRFWGEAVVTANFLQNRLPSKNLDKTPNEYWHGSKPIYSNLKRFGARCFVKIPDERRRKLDVKAIEARLMGHDTEAKAYRCYVPKRGIVVVSRDVKFVNDPMITDSGGDVQEHSDKSAKPTFEVEICPIKEGEVEEDNNSSKPVSNDSSDADDSDIASDDEETGDDDTANNDPTLVNEPRRSQRSNKGVPPERYCNISIVINNEPLTYNEALSSDQKEKWISAMREEINSMRENDAWTLVDLPDAKNLIGCKWVYKMKTDTDGNVKRYKARLVAQGYSQKYGMDYDQVFAPVARQTTLRILLSVAVSRGMVVHHFDVKTAFLNGDLQEEIYMKQPQGFIKEGQERKVCLLRKSIYGLKQSARVWNQKLHDVLVGAGFKQSKDDQCLYTIGTNNSAIYVLIYVDDILVASHEIRVVKKLANIMGTEFTIEDLGAVRDYLGIRIGRDDRKFTLDQEKYIKCIAKKIWPERCKGLRNTNLSIVPRGSV